MKKDELLTIIQLADVLQVSRHTIQAWVSPSSPNHRPEFAALARHAGRKTVFYKNEVKNWLDQRKGPIYSQDLKEVSPYWREKFKKSRGMLKGLVKPITRSRDHNRITSFFSTNTLALDTEPLLIWLTDSQDSQRVLEVVEGAETLMLSAVLVNWLLSKAFGKENYFYLLKDFLLDQNIFVIAPLDELALNNLWNAHAKINDMSYLIYFSCNAANVDYLLTTNRNLLQIKSLNLIPL